MIRHDVMFKFKPFDSEEEKLLRLNKIKNELEGLISVISYLRDLRVSFNINPNEQWDILLETELDSMEDVIKYGKEPAHVEIVKSLIRPILENRACIDHLS